MDDRPRAFRPGAPGPNSREPLRSFSADVFRGHFERGGARAHADVRFLVEKVVYFRRLDPTPRTRAEAVYLPVGSFLFKQLDSRPDMDHIVKLAEPARAPLTVPLDGLANPEATLARKVPVVGAVYFETGDLR